MPKFLEQDAATSASVAGNPNRVQAILDASTRDPDTAIGDLTIAAPSTGAGLHGMPGDSLSPSRFVRAFTIAKHVKSNAIVYARGGATVGIGAGNYSANTETLSAGWDSYFSQIMLFYGILFCTAGIAVLAAWGYTGGKHPYGYLGLGDLFVFVYFGLVATLGTTFTQASRLKAWW